MTQQTKAINLGKFEAGDRPTDQDFTNLFDSILFINESNGLSSNSTTLLGDFDIGGSLSILGGGNISISGSFSAGDPTAGVAGGRISAFTATDSPPFYASSSISEIMFSGISSKTTSSIALTTKGSDELTSGDVRFGIENGKGFLDAQGTTVISYSTGSSATAGGDNIIHMSASVGIGTISPSYKLHVRNDSAQQIAYFRSDNAGANFVRVERGSNTTIDLVAGATSHGGGLVGSKELRFMVNEDSITSPLMTLDTNNNVGIGTAAPTEKLHVKGTTSATRVLVETTTGNAQLRLKTNNNHFGLVSQGATDRLDIFDSNANTTPIKIFGGNPSNTLVLDGAGKIGIGTDNPSQKLDIIGGHIQLESGYGIGRNIGNALDEHIIYPYLTGMPTSFTNITAQGNVDSNGMSLQSDQTINFIETDDNVLVGHMDLNSKVFDWDGLINANQFKGDGSQLTGITGGQITGFVSTPGDNRLVTSNATGDGVFGEANLTFDGSTLAFTSAATDPGTNGYIGFPLLDDTGGEIFRTALKFPSTDDRALIQYGTVTNDDFELRLRLQDGNADKFVIISDSSNDYRALDINGNRALFFSDNSAGKVGIGTTSPSANLHIASTADAAIWLEADTDNATESHNPYLKITQDNQQNKGYFGYVGDVNTDPENNAATNTLINSMYIGNTTTHPIQLVTDNTARVTVTSGGKVGIGTNDPAAKLDVRGDVVISDGTDPAITLFNNDTVANGPDILFHQAGLIAAEGKMHLNFNSAGVSEDLFIRTGGDTDSATEIARFTNTGRLGLGGIDPSHQLHIKSAATNQDIVVISSAGTSATKIIQITDTTSGHGLIDVLSNGEAVGTNSARIYGGGSSYFMNSLGIGTSNPSYSLDVAGSVMSETGADSGRFLMGGRTDLGTISDNYDIQIQAPGHVIAMIDSNDNDTDHSFKVKIHSSTVDGGTERFRVQQNGEVYINNGMYIASATGISGLAGSVFAGESGTLRRHIFYFPAAAGSNDSGRIEHLTSTTLTNSSVIRLCPGDDQGATDYVTICGHDEPEMIRLFASGEGHFRGGLAVGALWNDTGTDVRGDKCEDGTIHVKSNAKAKLILQADGNNDNAGDSTDTSFVKYSQDGDLVRAYTGFVGDAGDDPDNNATSNSTFSTYQNMFWLGTQTDDAIGMFTNDLRRLTISATDFTIAIGIGASNASVWGSDGNGGSPLLLLKSHHEGSNADSDTGGGIRFVDNDTEEYWDNAIIDGILHWSHRSGNSGNATKQFKANADSEEETIAFTGQHPCRPTLGEVVDYKDKVGYIVVADGTYNNGFFSNGVESKSTPTINEALPHVKLSTKEKEKSVFGVISNAEDLNDGNSPVYKDENSPKPYREWTNGSITSFLRYEEGDERIWINSIGEGAVLVSNINGNLENGDYITTSHIEGLGMKQDDDLLHNYTVAKITQDCNFASGTTDVTHNGVTYKAKLVGCTYHCG